jgi:hypothetical protein
VTYLLFEIEMKERWGILIALHTFSSKGSSWLLNYLLPKLNGIAIFPFSYERSLRLNSGVSMTSEFFATTYLTFSDNVKSNFLPISNEYTRDIYNVGHCLFGRTSCSINILDLLYHVVWLYNTWDPMRHTTHKISMVWLLQH